MQARGDDEAGDEGVLGIGVDAQVGLGLGQRDGLRGRGGGEDEGHLGAVVIGRDGRARCELGVGQRGRAGSGAREPGPARVALTAEGARGGRREGDSQ